MAVWSIVSFSALSEDHRIDAEHYRPECLAQAEAVAAMSNAPLASLADVSDGNHISIAESFTKTGVRYLRGQDLSDFFIADASPVHIPEAVYTNLRRSHILPGDVLLGIVATIGAVSFVTDRFGKLTGNCKIAILRPRKIEGEFLAVYFLSELGQREIHRWARGTVQTGVILPDLKKLSIPIIPEQIRTCITETVRAAYSAREIAVARYAEAEAVLTDALGLDRVDLTPRLFYEDTYAHAAGAARFDAEYHSPRMQNVIKTLSTSGKTIGDVVTLMKRRFKAIPGKPFDYIEIADVSTAGTAGSSTVAGEDAPGRATWTVKPGDIITTTVRPIRRLSAIILPEQDGFVCSSGFAVLRPRDIEPELLLTYLRLPLVAELLDLYTTASMYPAISTADLLRIPLQIPDERTRTTIASMVRVSLAARAESISLLDEAKNMVENAIVPLQSHIQT